ncbi:MAG: GHKL domain-containing protein [Bifidobacterium dentium]
MGCRRPPKRTRLAHGLGLKSIRRIAKRYGGDVLVTAIPPIFTVQVSLLVK